MKLNIINDGWQYQHPWSMLNSDKPLKVNDPDGLREKGDFTYNPTDQPEDFSLTPDHLQVLDIQKHAIKPEYMRSGVKKWQAGGSKIYYIFNSDSALMLGLARAIKNPKKESEAEAKHKLLKISIEALKNIDYDIVVHPESSSTFNADLADSLGAKSLQIPKAKNVDADFRELMRRAILIKFYDLTKRGRSASEFGKGGRKKSLQDARWPYHSAMRDQRTILSKTKDRKKVSVKSIWHDKRRYLNLYDKVDASDITGKSVLLIDDNIRSVGTAEILLAQLIELGASKVAVFTPILLPSS
jgi:hypothetical protein